MLRLERRRLGLSRARLSRLGGFADNYVSHLETGLKGDMTTSSLVRLAGVLGLKLTLIPSGLTIHPSTSNHGTEHQATGTTTAGTGSGPGCDRGERKDLEPGAPIHGPGAGDAGPGR